MTLRAPVAITGANGRLGTALMEELGRIGIERRPWSRPDFDLDDPGAAARMVARDRPRLVIHSAAWTDVDGCARDPALAHRRNGEAVGELAEACMAAGTDLVYVSTNEVFDGQRTDGRGYRETDGTGPLNPYGASKLAGELAARAAYGAAASARGRLWIVRTCWLYGPPGNDFPSKILAASDRLVPNGSLPVVADEVGSPTYTIDLADAMLRLVGADRPGVFHLVNQGSASRYEWAAEVLGRCGRAASLARTRSADYVRVSQPPRWAVLDCSAAAMMGVRMRPWQAAFREYSSSLCPG